LEEVSLVGEVAPSTFVRRVHKASEVIRSVTYFLEATAGLLRQLVHVVGWIVLLAGLTNLLLHPHLSLEHLVVPGAGTLAIVQNLIRCRQRHSDQAMIQLDESSLMRTLLPVEVEAEGEVREHRG
jgi:hypothetical protein